MARAKDDSKREDDEAYLYLLPKWWANVMELKKKKNPWHKKFDFTTGCSSTSRGGEYNGRIETPLAVD